MSEHAQSFPGAYCDTCGKWRKPSALMPDGSCPRCRSVLDEDKAELHAAVEAGTVVQTTPKIPWHFWVMVAATVLYLGWRLIQGIGAIF